MRIQVFCEAAWDLELYSTLAERILREEGSVWLANLLPIIMGPQSLALRCCANFSQPLRGNCLEFLAIELNLIS